MSTSVIEKQIEEFNEILIEYVNTHTNNMEWNVNLSTPLQLIKSDEVMTKTVETQTSDLPSISRIYGMEINDGTTSQYHNFIRLNLLFPDLHPATIHGALGLCKNDFILTVDSLIYARNHRNHTQTNNNTSIISQTQSINKN